ncbi:MAG: hypothetical protein IJV04_00735 [Lachnospiraceae bacterium]|nr:hypothetical protein [Lachnospiraceae bacterium]
MTVKEAIRKADAMRPNAIPDETKAAWLYEVEGELAEMMDVDAPENSWPETDAELLMPYPHDGMYALYLMAMIDNANEETALYQNDMVIAQNAINESRAWWWRNSSNRKGYTIKVM